MRKPWEPASLAQGITAQGCGRRAFRSTSAQTVLTIQGPKFTCSVPTAIAPQASVRCWESPQPVELGGRAAVWGQASCGGFVKA